MGAGNIAVRIATQHSGDLGHTSVAIHDGDIRRSDTFTRALRDDDVVMRARGDLRQVSDREDLMVLGDTTQGIPHLETDPPADPSVHFVKDERRYAVEPRQNRLEREHDTRELAA